MRSHVSRAIAIVGVGARFPGAPDLETFWKKILARETAVREVPEGRWPISPTALLDPEGRPDRLRSIRGCYLDLPEGVGEPSHWLAGVLAEEAWASAGFGEAERERASVVLANIVLPTPETSRFTRETLGKAFEAWALGRKAPPVDVPPPLFATAGAARAAVERLGLGGGGFTLDAACASSLFAIHLACLELEAGRVDAVLAGGLSLPDSLYTQVGFTQLRALSPSGRCLPFDRRADGLVVGEGGALFALQRLEDAVAEGRTILGVIRGIGLSNDLGGSLLSPESEGQLRAMRAAYEEAGWDPEEVDLVECHGTGTPRGDEVEVASLRTLFGGASCVIGSVKSNVGHLLTGAGAASLAKVLFALGEGVLPPTAGFSKETASPALEGSGLEVLEAPRPWPERKGPRRAAVSGFGFGGTNAHLLVEAWEAGRPVRVRPSQRRSPTEPPIAVVAMASHFGSLEDREAFREALFEGRSPFAARPASRWPYEAAIEGTGAGAFLERLKIVAGRFRIPPKEIPTLLPQHLLALETAVRAAEEAGLAKKGRHHRAGAVIGLDLDWEATSFHLRWLVEDWARRWAAESGETVAEEELAVWTEALRDALGPALDASRTLGALGGVVASRIARELSLGGPSMTVSEGAASGLRAIEVAARLLRAGEVDWMIAGAVDVFGDLRNLSAGGWGESLPFDERSHGARPGEGAGAVVLCRLEDAVRDGRKVLAVIRGIGAASGARASARAWAEAGVDAAEVGLLLTNASDEKEATALREAFPGVAPRIALGTPIAGQAGAATGIAAGLQAVVALSERFLPPSPPIESPVGPLRASPFHFPLASEPWLTDRGEKRRAAVRCVEGDSAFHLLLEEGPRSARRRRRAKRREDLAFVFPGTGSHFLGMGRLFARFPEAFGEAHDWRSHFMQPLLSPWRTGFGPNWKAEAEAELRRHPEKAMLAQVAYGIAAHDLLRELGLEPAALVGYSLGESAALLASGAWPEREAMFRRTLESPLFRRLVFGDYQVVRETWGEEARFLAAIVGAPADEVRKSLVGTTELMVVNAPDECMIGGREEDVEATLAALGRPGVPLAGVPSVHHSLARKVEAEYRALHEQPTLAPEVRIYSGAFGGAYTPTRETTVESILRGAFEGFDFARTIEAAYADGIRTFVEVGPQASMTRLIRRILGDRPHLAVSISAKDRDPVDALEEALLRLREAGYEVELPRAKSVRPADRPVQVIEIPVGRPFPAEAPAPPWGREAAGERRGVSVEMKVSSAKSSPSTALVPTHGVSQPPMEALRTAQALGATAQALARAAAQTSAAHAAFLERSAHGFALQAAALEARRALLAQLGLGDPSLEGALANIPPMSAESSPAAWTMSAEATSAHPKPLAADSWEMAADPTRAFTDHRPPPPDLVRPAPREEKVAFTREQCMEFAVGSIAKVLGPAFAKVDSHPTRVRLPDEPLMLVDRIVEVEGKLGELGPLRCVTEHDVLEGQWYLDGGRAPVCISVESGQADLFLCAYAGMDLITGGERVYRLLDAKVIFHRDLPRPGETIRYDIRVRKFIEQGSTYLLFFDFDGTIDGEPFITMREGCAGFFSQAQLESGRGIVGELPRNRPPRRRKANGEEADPFTPLVPMEATSLDEEQVEALREGDLERAFGPHFAGKKLAPSLRLPSGRMRLVDRIVSLEPEGGRYGMGRVIGEADIDPQAWFLTCHFQDDYVMPGTLMYECCLHTLRVFLLRMGWVIEEGEEVHYAPVVSVQSQLKCRGQVTPKTRAVRYRIDIKEIGYDPEPYAIADASMIIDGQHAVEMENMSIRLAGAKKEDIEATWSEKTSPIPTESDEEGRPVYDRRHIEAFALGSPVAAFGERYRPFEKGRRMARLPAPPFSFIDRIVPLAGQPWELAVGSRAESRYAIPEGAWYFEASRQDTLPFAVLLETALQPCGWLAAWQGSALLGGEEDLFFRNLEGEATLHAPLDLGGKEAQVKVELENVSQAGGMILQAFRFELFGPEGPIYTGKTRFGFFPEASLATQAGLPEKTLREDLRSGGFAVEGDSRWRFLDRVEALSLEEGFAWASKEVKPEDWFFAAHFPGDPVMPGSLGIESFLQLARIWGERRWPDLAEKRILSPSPGQHSWRYRGQVRPTARRVDVQLFVRELDETAPALVADGLLAVDGKVIYEMLGFRLAWET